MSEADYHPTHRHYHIAAFAQTFLYEYDEATQARGDLAAQGGKTGFCVVDGGPLDPMRPLIATPLYVYGGGGCCYYAVFCEMDAVFEDDFTMGLSGGWFDVYPWWRSGQHVDSVADGVYELVTVVNPEARMIESDVENNAGGVLLRLTGNSVEVLASWTQAPGGAYEWSRGPGGG